MAQELQRTFDTNLKAVVVVFRDDFGNETPHTIYVTGSVDVAAEIARIKSEIESSNAAAIAKMRAAGWQG
jgi:hypothetical protein